MLPSNSAQAILLLLWAALLPTEGSILTLDMLVG